ARCSARRGRGSSGPTTCCSTTARSPAFCARAVGREIGCSGSRWASVSTCATPYRLPWGVPPWRSRSACHGCAAWTCSTGSCPRWSRSARSSRRSRSGNAPPSLRVTGCGAVSCDRRRRAAPAGSVPTGRWGPPRSARLVPDVARGFAVGAVCAAGLLFDDNAARLAAVWHDDRPASVALLAGAAAWGAAVATTRQRTLWHWYAAAAGAALLPEAAVIALLRPSAPSGFVAPFVFFLIADTTVALVTEELAFRRAPLGPPESARLSALVLMAVAFGLWHAVQPAYGGAPLGTFLGTALGGFVAGCIY